MVRVLVPTGALGLGYDKDALARGIAAKPDIISIDGGSTDSGPHYLGTGTSKYSRGSTKEFCRELLRARAEAAVPLVIGTAGTCGADSAVEWMVDIIKELVEEESHHLRIATLKSGQKAEAMIAALDEGRITPLEPAPKIDADALESTTNMVALAGIEQIWAALETGADLVIAGRTTDTALIAALPIARGCHPGAAWHGAKIGECGAMATTRPASGTILLDFDETGVTITPMGAGAQATPRTVSAHMIYENADPYRLLEPGGTLDVSDATYKAVSDHQTRIEGSQWTPSKNYTVKLEGARQAGFQTVTLALVREPRYVAQIESWCAEIEAEVHAKAAGRVESAYSIELRLIGRDATLGALDSEAVSGSELGVMGIVTADDAQTARDVAKLLNPYLLHHALTPDEEMPTFAFPFSPPEIDRGPVYEFCLNHVLTLKDPMEAFRLDVQELAP